MPPLAAAATTTADIVLCVVFLTVTFVVAEVADRLLASRAGGISRVLTKTLPAADETRLRVARRLVVAAIVFVGVTTSLVQLPAVRTVASGLLASAGITALVVGFASRTVLANLISGIIVALAQPVRIGDYVAIGDWQGTIEEIRLTYSYIRADDDSRIVIPNEQLGSTVIRNFSIVDQTSGATIDFAVPISAPLADVRSVALEAAAAYSRGRSPERKPSLTVLELGVDAVRLRLAIWNDDKAAADRAAAELRFALPQKLRDEGLLGPAAAGPAEVRGGDAAPPPDDTP